MPELPKKILPFEFKIKNKINGKKNKIIKKLKFVSIVKNIKINKKLSISDKNPPLIIAEISGNHCGKKSIFLKHIKEAAKSGADLIKIQTYEPIDITVKNKPIKFCM